MFGQEKMTEKQSYYARYDLRYRKVRELGLPAFKNEESLQVDIALLDSFLNWSEDTRPPKRVLEFGCGDGYLAVHLAKRGYSVVAFDYSAAAIQGCRVLANDQDVDVDFRIGNALHLDWVTDASFDFGVSNNVLQMFATTEDREQCVCEMRRVLKPGALLFLNVPSDTDVPEESHSIAEHRRHREFLCDLKGTVNVDGKEQVVTWPQVASWGPNIYSAASYFRDRGFELRYIHWEHGRGYGHGLTMYLEKGREAEPATPADGEDAAAE